MDFLTLLILTLATWRISSLLTNDNEVGPFEVLSKFRQWAIEWTNAFTCLWCASVWVAIVIVICYAIRPDYTTWACLPLAMSAGAIAWDKWNGG